MSPPPLGLFDQDVIDAKRRQLFPPFNGVRHGSCEECGSDISVDRRDLHTVFHLLINVRLGQEPLAPLA